MDLKKINEQLKPKEYGTTLKGVMGVKIGYDLHLRLQTYAKKHNFKMAQIIKLLIKSYLDEMEEK